MLHQIKAPQFHTDLGLKKQCCMHPLENGKIQGLWVFFKYFSRSILFSWTFQDSPIYSSTFQACANPGTLSWWPINLCKTAGSYLTLHGGWKNCHTNVSYQSLLKGYTVKRPLSKGPQIGFQDQLLLNAGQKYCRMLQWEHSAILLTFIKLPFVIKIFVLSIFEWPFYTGFTVLFNSYFCDLASSN